MRHLGTVPLETSRLILRRLNPSDAIAMYETWTKDPEVSRFLRWEPHTDWMETAQLLAAWNCLYANADYYQWAICLKESGTLIGGISLIEGEEQTPAAWQAAGLDFSFGVWEPGYCLGRAFWNQGYTTEALAAVRDFWFTQVKGPWLACCHAVQNPASGRVMEKAGWQFDHAAVYHKFDGTAVDCRAYYLMNPNRN